MVACNKCSRAPAAEPDTWCVACRGVEALGVELAGSWHLRAVREQAEDAIVAAVRAVKGLRSLGASLSSAEQARASHREIPHAKIHPKSAPCSVATSCRFLKAKEESSYEELEESGEEEGCTEDPPITTRAKSDPSKLPTEPRHPPGNCHGDHGRD